MSKKLQLTTSRKPAADTGTLLPGERVQGTVVPAGWLEVAAGADVRGPSAGEGAPAARRALLRRQVLEQRLALPAHRVAELSERVRAHLLSHPAWQACRAVLAYASFRQEVDTFPVLAAALTQGKELILPRVDRRRKRLDLLRVSDPGADLRSGYQGILEPDPARCPPVDAARIDLVLVPGVVFDRRGFRLGYGGGYYDRLLASLPGAVRVGLAFSLQVVDEIPALAHDLPVDILVTEEGALQFRAAGTGLRGDDADSGW
ncbi:MAG: 5-formyltetrahydrofolate cyclo-ligase [Bacillota bacterium]|nr:5-formyltetrahydrofolate cyclo-ligase [Bacillota bacterium]